jgi:hypothetical protein
MAGKSRRRGRHLPQTKKKKNRRGNRPLVASAPVAAQQSQATPRADVRPVATRTAASRAAIAPSLNVASELRRIGILAGIIGVILLALYFFLP